MERKELLPQPQGHKGEHTLHAATMVRLLHELHRMDEEQARTQECIPNKMWRTAQMAVKQEDRVREGNPKPYHKASCNHVLQQHRTKPSSWKAFDQFEGRSRTGRSERIQRKENK